MVMNKIERSAENAPLVFGSCNDQLCIKMKSTLDNVAFLAHGYKGAYRLTDGEKRIAKSIIIRRVNERQSRINKLH